MGCFLVPMSQAIVTTIVQKVVKNKEQKSGVEHIEITGITWSRKLGWLNKMLWSGAALLVLEHIWHGEMTLQPPFFTALSSPVNVAPFIYEIATEGIAVSLALTLIWGIIVLIAENKTRGVSEVNTSSK